MEKGEVDKCIGYLGDSVDWEGLVMDSMGVEVNKLSRISFWAQLNEWWHHLWRQGTQEGHHVLEEVNLKCFVFEILYLVFLPDFIMEMSLANEYTGLQSTEGSRSKLWGF